MRFLLVLSLSMLVYGTTGDYATDYANMRERTLRITQGKDFRAVWVRTNGSADKDLAYEGANLLSYDSKTDEVKQLSPGNGAGDWRNDPQLDQQFNIRPYQGGLTIRYNYISPDGNKIIFNLNGFDNANMESWVMDWNDWSTITPLEVPTSYVLCVGQDPQNGKNWAYYTDVYDKGKMLGRFNIDNPDEYEELLQITDGQKINHFAGVSADLSTIVCGGNRATLQFDLTNPSSNYVDLKAVDGEPIGSCNIMLSPDDEMNPLWIGQYLWDYTSNSGAGGMHSAIAVNSSLSEPSTRVDFPVPNLAPHTNWQSDPGLSTNTVIATQWAYETQHARIFSYVAYYGCFSAGINSCPNHAPRATIARFNDDLNEIVDFEQFFPDDNAASVNEARPYVWIYKDASNISKSGFATKTKKIAINTIDKNLVINLEKPLDISVKLFATNGAVVYSQTVKNRSQLTVDKSSLKSGMYFMSVFTNGKRVNQRTISIR